MHASVRVVGWVACALVVSLVASCTADAPTPPTTTATPTQQVTPAADVVVATRTIAADGGEVDVTVRPLVRDDDEVILTLDLDPKGSQQLDVSERFRAYLPDFYDAPQAIRLFDLADGWAHEVASDAEGEPAAMMSTGTWMVPVEGARLQMRFAAPPPGTDAVGLFLPGASYVDRVPVLDGDVPPLVPAESESAAPTATGKPSASPAPVLPEAAVAGARFRLESQTKDLTAQVSTEVSVEEVKVTLGSDVLFAFGSAELTPQANDALAVAAAGLSGREPGPVSVVGHTDDVSDTAFNQTLSEQRAQAVADALAGLVDTKAFPLQPSGRGETEPLAANDSEENRALNRRVTLTLASTRTESTQSTGHGATPEYLDGPTATNTDGVLIDSPYSSWRATVQSARLVDGHLVVDLELVRLDEAVNDIFQMGSLDGGWSVRYRELGEVTADGLRAVTGSTALYPLDYQAEPPSEKRPTGVWRSATDLYPKSRIDTGQTLTVSVIFPEVEDLSTVIVQHGNTRGNFRLTDVPVTNG